MICLLSETSNPYLNLATEEFLLKNRSEDLCFLYINTPVIVVGKHQNAISEANMVFSIEQNIPVLRRISGGGAVYHDEGNLNFCFITNGKPGELVDFRRYTKPVVDFLVTLGIETEYAGSNNLTVNGKKISGNAEHVFKNRVLHHGTLLYNCNLQNLQNSLRPVNSEYTDKSVKSKPWAVANIRDLLSVDIEINEFARQLLDFVARNSHGKYDHLTNEDKLEINILANSRYKTWEWTYGYFTEYVFEKAIEISSGNFPLKFRVCKGIILDVAFDTDLPELEKALTDILLNTRHCPDEIRYKLQNHACFKDFSEAEIKQLVKQLF
jgi:lipoate-protein ligase A